MRLSQNPNVHAPVWVRQHLVISQIRHILLCLCARTSAQSAALCCPPCLSPRTFSVIHSAALLQHHGQRPPILRHPSVFRDARNVRVSPSLCLCSVVPLGLSLQVTSTWLNPCSYIGRTESRVSMLNLISTLLLRVMGLWASNSTCPGHILSKCRR